MSVIQPFAGKSPSLGRECFVADTAALIGDLVIGDRSSVWFGCVLRADIYPIQIGSDCSIQDNTVIHVAGGKFATIVGDRVTVGHRALLHGCKVADECLIGMGAIIMDGATIGEGSIVGAGALVPPGAEIPPGKLALGSPARVVRDLRPQELDEIRKSAIRYVDLARTYLAQSADNSVT